MSSRLFRMTSSGVVIFLLALAASVGYAQSSDYKAFHYVRDPGSGMISRVEVTSDEYEQRQNAMKMALKAVIMQVLSGAFQPTPETFEISDENPLSPLLAHPNFLLMPTEPTPQMLQQATAQGRAAGQPLTDEARMSHIQTRLKRLFAVTQEMEPRLRDNPEYLDEVAESMAAWTIYYLNLSNWNAYVAQNVLRVELEDNERPTHDPATENISATHAALQTRAQTVSQELENTYKAMVANVEKERMAQANYDEWQRSRQDEMVAFADKWMRRYEGREIEIDDTIFMVRTYAERPRTPADDRMKEYLPTNGVIVEIPREKVVTPFDLIGETGRIKAGGE